MNSFYLQFSMSSSFPFSLYVCTSSSLSLSLSSNWSYRASSSLGSVVREVTCVFDSCALPWRHWNQNVTERLTHSLTQWQSDLSSCPKKLSLVENQLRQISLLTLRISFTLLRKSVRDMIFAVKSNPEVLWYHCCWLNIDSQIEIVFFDIKW